MGDEPSLSRHGKRAAAARTAAVRRPDPPKESSFIPTDIDRLWTMAEQRVPDWKTISVRFETSPSAPLTFSIEQGYRGRPDLRSQLTLDPKTGAVVRWEPFSSFNLGRRTPHVGALRPHRRGGGRFGAKRSLHLSPPVLPYWCAQVSRLRGTDSGDANAVNARSPFPNRLTC